MIANAKAVAHGIRAMLYVSGESRNKKHPEKITRICDNFMPGYLDGNEVRHHESPKYQEQCHPYGDKSGNGAYSGFHVG